MCSKHLCEEKKTLTYYVQIPALTTNHILVYVFVSFIVQFGINPLYAASACGHTDVVDVLVKAGADVLQSVADEV